MGADASKTGDAAAGTTVDAGAGTTVDTTGDAKDSSADTKDAKGTASNGEDTDGLEGDTEEEMRSDAADLLKDYKASSNEDPKDRKRPANDAGKSGGSAAGTAVDMNRLLRAAAGKGGK
jgi:hypothetical protein